MHSLKNNLPLKASDEPLTKRLQVSRPEMFSIDLIKCEPEVNFAFQKSETSDSGSAPVIDAEAEVDQSQTMKIGSQYEMQNPFRIQISRELSADSQEITMLPDKIEMCSNGSRLTKSEAVECTPCLVMSEVNSGGEEELGDFEETMAVLVQLKLDFAHSGFGREEFKKFDRNLAEIVSRNAKSLMHK